METDDSPVGAGLVPARYPKRKTIRLKDYDYSQNGLYFVTICVQDRLCLFGEISQGKVLLNPAGEMIHRYYLSLEKNIDNIECLNCVIMPNHIHFILRIDNNGALAHIYLMLFGSLSHLLLMNIFDK